MKVKVRKLQGGTWQHVQITGTIYELRSMLESITYRQSSYVTDMTFVLIHAGKAEICFQVVGEGH